MTSDRLIPSMEVAPLEFFGDQLWGCSKAFRCAVDVKSPYRNLWSDSGQSWFSEVLLWGSLKFGKIRSFTHEPLCYPSPFVQSTIHNPLSSNPQPDLANRKEHHDHHTNALYSPLAQLNDSSSISLHQRSLQMPGRSCMPIRRRTPPDHFHFYLISHMLATILVLVAATLQEI